MRIPKNHLTPNAIFQRPALEKKRPPELRVVRNSSSQLNREQQAWAADYAQAESKYWPT